MPKPKWTTRWGKCDYDSEIYESYPGDYGHVCPRHAQVEIAACLDLLDDRINEEMLWRPSPQLRAAKQEEERMYLQSWLDQDRRPRQIEAARESANREREDAIRINEKFKEKIS